MNSGNATYAVGADVGGTRARALLTREGRELARGEAGGGNLRHVGPTAVVESVVAATAAAFEAANLPLDLGACAVHAGVAGLATPADEAALQAAPHPFARLTAQSDAFLALGAHFGGESGVLLIVGTGCIALARGQDGRIHRRLGWGFPLEEGGGADLGLRALRLGLRDWENGERTFVAQALAGEFAAPRALIEWARGQTPGGFARFAPLLFEAVAQGDGRAQSAVRAWGEACGDAVRALQEEAGVTRWGAHGGLAPRLPLALRPTPPAQPRHSPVAWAAELARRAPERGEGQAF